MLMKISMWSDVFDIMIPFGEVLANVLEKTAACILHCENGGCRFL
jgi:hypothetical protein